MKFVELSHLSNADNSVCEIKDLPATVGEFIAEATALGGWGDIDICTLAKVPIIRVEYKHGQHGNPAPEIAALPIQSARSVGGWGRCDYKVYV